MLHRLGHAGRLVIVLQRRRLADSGAAQSAAPAACRWCFQASSQGRAEYSGSTVPASAQAADGAASSAATPTGDTQRRAAVNRLMYRSKQRGFLELDLLVGLWAERNVPHMSMPQLRAFEEVLDIENPDLFKWLTGQEAAPDALRDNASFMVRAKLQLQLPVQLLAQLACPAYDCSDQSAHAMREAVQMLQSDVRQQIAQHRPSAAQTPSGTAWVRRCLV